MQFKKLFDFTQQLESNLKKLSEIPNISSERKAEILKKLEILGGFNKMYNSELKAENSSHHL